MASAPSSTSVPLTSLEQASGGTDGAAKVEYSDDRSSSTPTAGDSSKTAAPDKEKPRLTEQEKKNNHIASEQKRRAAIREGFDRLTELVPGLEGQGRSEGIVLRKTVDFIRVKLQERQELMDEIEARSGRIDEEFRRKT